MDDRDELQREVAEFAGIRGGLSEAVGPKSGDPKSGDFGYIGRHHVVVLAVVLLVCSATAFAAPPRIQRFLQRLDRQRQEQTAPAVPETDGLDPWLRRLHEVVPQSADAFAQFDVGELAEAARAVESWSAQWGRIAVGQATDEQIALVGRLHDVKQSVDRQLENVLTLRTELGQLPDDDRRHEGLRRYLRTANALIDLSGRLRYLLVDVIDGVAFRVAHQPAVREQLIDLLAARHSGVGAQVLAVALFDPPADNPDMPPPLTEAQKQKLLRFIAESGNLALVVDLADFLLDAATPPSQVLAAAEAIRELGLPQDPRPDQDSTLPEPAITAKQLRERLAQIDPSRWTSDERQRVEALLAWLFHRAEGGLDGESYRLGCFDVQPGDWLLMRNPSPYNLFTDLSPGLFTHVGVVALETGSDGKRRMVIVDLPERGTSMPATNVETFLDRTRHYVFVRHPDAAAGRTMGETAATLIGNPTEFDLNFRTDRVAALKGKPLKGQKVHTYCAGFLLLCAQETGLPSETFFPITETTAGGYTKENLAKLGLSLGEGFVSPTGALFSPVLEIAGRSEPMYDARREVEEAIFDYFAMQMENAELQPSPDAFQTLRLKVAEASKNNPLLAKALAVSAGVSEEMDLVSAAKAAAVVETLDEIAFGCSGEYLTARRAIMRGVPAPAARRTLPAEEREMIEKYRTRHRELTAHWDQRLLSPRQLRIELVRYYVRQGRRQLDERFFGG